MDINQHKRMAGAGANVTSDSFPVRTKPHPDANMDTGRTMNDGERAIGAGGISYDKGKMPAQSAPDHGPHHLRGR